MSASASQDRPQLKDGGGDAPKQHFREWWAAARQSEEPPSVQDYLINLGIPVHGVDAIIRNVFEVCCPSEKGFYAGPGSLALICKHVARPKQFLCSTPTEPHPYRGIPDGDRILDSALSPEWAKEITEQDLLALADSTKPSDWKNIVKLCLFGNYSAAFYQVMFRKVPAIIFRDRYDLRHHTFEHSQLAWNDSGMSALTLIAKTIRLSGFWILEDYRLVLTSLLRSDLAHLELSFPAFFREENETERGVANALLWHQITAGIDFRLKELHINMRKTWLFRSGDTYPWQEFTSLAMLPDMSRLQTLTVESDDEEYALVYGAPSIVQLLENPVAALTKLTIREKAIASTQKPTVLPILEALKKNQSLSTFRYERDASWTIKYNYDSYREIFTAYNEKALEALRVNTSLKKIDICARKGERDVILVHVETLRLKIVHYLVANAFGRKVARDPRSTVKQLVDQMDGATQRSNPDIQELDEGSEESSKANENFELGTLNIHYQLLREMPSKWSNNIPSSVNSSGLVRKRKYDDGH